MRKDSCSELSFSCPGFYKEQEEGSLTLVQNLSRAVTLIGKVWAEVQSPGLQSCTPGSQPGSANCQLGDLRQVICPL